MDNVTNDSFGWLHHKAIRKDGTNDSFYTERVKVRHLYADNWQVYFEGKWRKVYIQVKKTFIKYQNQNIEIQIEGV